MLNHLKLYYELTKCIMMIIDNVLLGNMAPVIFICRRKLVDDLYFLIKIASFVQ